MLARMRQTSVTVRRIANTNTSTLKLQMVAMIVETEKGKSRIEKQAAQIRWYRVSDRRASRMLALVSTCFFDSKFWNSEVSDIVASLSLMQLL